MFVYYYVEVDLPLLEAWARLSDALASAGEWAGDAYRHGEAIQAKAGPEHSHFAKSVRIELHEASAADGIVTIPMVWTATGTPGLFPRLEADLVIGALGTERSQVALRGTYTPPLGSIGRALDRLALHRIAEAAIKSFVDRIAGALVVEPARQLLG
jgi:hypothetical protein